MIFILVSHFEKCVPTIIVSFEFIFLDDFKKLSILNVDDFCIFS
jgi:hypothetical protein